MTLPALAALREEYEAIRAALGDARTSQQREQVKRRLMALFRQADGALNDLVQLKEDIRGLVEQYKQLAAQDPGSVPRLPETRPLPRQDRLGASTFIEKGWHLITLGDHAGAVQALRRALQLAPADVQAEALLGWAQMLGEEYDEALGTFARVLEHDPGNALARVNVGYICLKKHIFGEAIEHLSGAIRLDSDRKATLYANYYLGLVYLEREMFADATAFLERAVALGPNLIEARYELGRALWFAGRREEATAAWSAAAAAGAFSPWSTRCRQLLELVAAGGEVPRSSVL
jgi:tetratricopeptide (TPR) repeat protein